jgi:hypothetical protein
MKIFLFTFFFATTSILPLCAQTTPAPQERIISVNGTAELEIIPDEIYVSVTIREFTKEKKKFTIEELEKTLLHFVETTTTTPRTDVKMDNTDARIIAMKRKEKDAIIEKSYEVKYKNNEQVTLLFASADSLNLASVSINRYSHSKIEQYKQDVRVQAVVNAKDKATYMLAALNQKPGKVLTVTENSPSVRVDDGIDEFRPFRGNVFQTQYSYQDASGGNSGDLIIDSSPLVKTIKLSYMIYITFEIVN